MLVVASIRLSPFRLVKTLAPSQFGFSHEELPHVSTIGPNIEAIFSTETFPI